MTRKSTGWRKSVKKVWAKAFFQVPCTKYSQATHCEVGEIQNFYNILSEHPHKEKGVGFKTGIGILPIIKHTFSFKCVS